MSDNKQKRLLELLSGIDSPMKTVVVDGETDIDAVYAEMEAKGLRFAAMSNAGLPYGQLRLTFLPSSAFRPDATNEGMSAA